MFVYSFNEDESTVFGGTSIVYNYVVFNATQTQQLSVYFGIQLWIIFSESL